MVMKQTENASSVTYWLLLCCGMVFVMALLGAITRLTGSGLSITSWDPVMGVLPPLTEAAWDKAFTAYKDIPQYRIVNPGMTLDAFKGLYFWEWFHRLWGRLIGVAFALPLIVFMARRHIDRRTGQALVLALALGFLEGCIGWFMVRSGLDVRTSVSPYRLALHLGFALAIYSLLFWTALCRTSLRGAALTAKKTQNESSFIYLRRAGWLALGLLATTILWGAFVAGLHAGEIYTTWPLMDGQIVPGVAWALQPLWLNPTENPALAQFLHRWLGPATMLVVLFWTAHGAQKADAGGRRWLAPLAVAAMAQVALGIATLLSGANIALAACHQAGAIALLSLLLVNLARLYPPPLPASSSLRKPDRR